MEVEQEFQRMSLRKKGVSIVFIGHVDAGKSTIGGMILYLGGKIDKRTLEKYEKESKEMNRESWYLSWALDSNQEEREKGKTTEVGYATFSLENYNIQILDAPGHKMYVPNMIIGVSQADIAILIISARQNEFEAGFEKGGQTREHIYLAKASGIQKICVLVNKMDDITVDWKEERYNQIVSTTKKLLTTLFGKDGVVYIPASGFQGDNLKERVSSSICPWYKGPTFFEYLNTLEIKRTLSTSLLANVTDVVKDISGQMVHLKIEKGVLEKTQLLLHPGQRKVTVIAIVKNEEEETHAYPGEIVQVKIREQEEINPGDLITGVDYEGIKDSNYYMAQISVLDSKCLLSKGYTAMMHMQARTVQVRIGELYKKENDKIQKVKFARAGERVMAEVFALQTLPLEVWAQERRTGIFTLRDELRTVGFGKVVKIKEKKE
ncbi:peptide chain release factor subunit 3 [Nematocida sp. LUAm3]|nr:peptide chain release factor subunit 3 [Nematocida sp. LUAm3]KAI5174617.1 peptide chain release factor subunit 3 [Nematocida sp. LUAm2]KAI5177977.1 peptide chain release factor subunit 3 [Nematocida sp. LUAm1]